MKTFKSLLCVVLAVLFAIPAGCFSVSATTPDSSCIYFTDSTAVSLFSGISGATVTFNEDEGAAQIKATSSAPSATYPISDFDGAYNYAIVTYRVHNTNSGKAFEGTLTFNDGSYAAPAKSFCYSRGYKYYSTVFDISDIDYADSVRFAFFKSCTSGDNMFLYSLEFTSSEEEAKLASEENAKEACGPILSRYTENTLINSNAYICEEYMVPYWETDIIYNEAVYPLRNKNGKMEDVTLMYDADRIVSVHNSQLTVEYKEGVDYELVDGKLRIIEGGSIPCVNYNNHYHSYEVVGTYRIIGGGYVRFEEGQSITRDQIAVTYIHSDEWEGYIPESKGDKLPRTVSKLENGENLNIVFFGDSITNGGNSSAEIDISPYAERWTIMFEKELCRLYPTANINCTNTSVSGGGWPDAVQNVYSSIIAYHPDLLVLALGTNDYQFQWSASETIDRMNYVVDTVKAYVPDCEIIMVAPMLSNPECFDPQLLDRYVAGFKARISRESGMVLADVTSVHRYLLTRKIYTDMSANNLCHLNDFLARVYGHTLIKTISPEYLSDTYRHTYQSRLSTVGNFNNYLPDEQEKIREIRAQAYSDMEYATTVDEAREIFLNARTDAASLPDKSTVIAAQTNYADIDFNTPESTILFSSVGGMNVSFNAFESSAALTASNISSDPRGTISFPTVNPVSASTKKYAVITYAVPASTSASAETAQFYYGAGSNAVPSDSQCREFTLVKDGKYHSEIIDLSSDRYWTGIVRFLRIDPFKACAKNDVFFLSSICLCETAEEAAETAAYKADVANGTYVGKHSVVVFDNEDALSYISGPLASILLGDANRDGEVSGKDSRLIKSEIAGNLKEGAYDLAYFDANADGEVSSKDSRFVKQIIVGAADPLIGYSDGEAPDVSFNSDSSSAIISKNDVEYATFSADLDFTPKYAVLVYQATGTSGSTNIYFGNKVVENEGKFKNLTVDNGYDAIILELPADYDSSDITVCIKNFDLEVDSFGFFESYANANSYANGILWDRKSPKIYNDNIVISFSDEMMKNITYSHNAVYNNNSVNQLSLTVNGNNGDPYAYLDLSGLGISADEYKYIVYTYMIPSSNSIYSINSQLFFCTTGGYPEPNEDAQMIFSTERTGALVDKTIDLSRQAFWKGDVNGLRLDFFVNCSVGDTLVLSSITFCKTQEDVKKALSAQ